MKIKISLAAIAALGAACAAEFFVSPAGDDNAAGTFAAPFATPARARDAVRAARKAGAKGGIIVWLRGGVYPLRRAWTFGKEDSGAADAPIAYRAWKDETPVLSGGWTVPASAWRKADDPRIPAAARGKVWAADVKSLGFDALEPDAPCGFSIPNAQFRILSLYRNGRLLTLARHPDKGFLPITVVDATNRVFTAALDDFARWSPAVAPDLQALGYWKYLWADQTVPVSVDPAARTITIRLVDQWNFPKKDAPFYLQNALGALDAPGEWFLDRAKGVLYLRPPADEAPASATYELARAAHPLLSVRDAAHLRFEGIVFRTGRHHGVTMSGVTDVAFEGCVVRDFGGTGFIMYGANGCSFRGNVLHTFGHKAAEINGGDRRAFRSSGTRIVANDVSDTGHAMRTYSHGFAVGGYGLEIARNHMHDLPSSAFSVGGNEHLVASNLVENVVLESDDQGGVDMWGDPTFRGNRFIHNIWRNVGRGGDYVKCGQAGIRFDDAISGNYVYGNRFDNCSREKFGGVQIHAGRDNVIRNNLFVRCRYGVSFSEWPMAHWRAYFQRPSTQNYIKAVDANGPAFLAKYPEFATTVDTPMNDTVEYNIFVGGESLFARKAAAAKVRGNVCLEKMPEDLTSVPGFDPLPPETAIGPGADPFLARARASDALLLSVLAALGGEGLAGACTWFVKGDGEVMCTAEGVAFRAPASLPAKVVSVEAGRVELELTTRDGPVKAVWARAADGALECVLSAPPGRAMSAPLAYPAGWSTREGDDLVLPFGEGVAYPVCDPEVAFTGSRFRLSNGMEASMGFFGIARAGVWAMTGVEDTLCGEIVCRTNAPYSAGVAWRASDGGTWGRDRRVRFFFARSIGEAAGKYRAWREAQGRVRTLAEKAKKNPHIASFSGTADFWLWDDNDQNRLYNWPLVEETPPLDVKRIAAEMKSLGMDRVLVNVFNGLSREDAAFLSRQGYLAGTYDCLRDMFHPGLLQVANPSNFVRAARFLPIAGDVARINPDGKPAGAWSIPDREGKMHPMQALCDAMAPEMCRRFIAPEVADVGYTSRLMDVQACGGPAACFSKTHPCTRAEALASLRAEHRYLADDLALVIGVEVGNENLLDSYHYAEGLPSLPHQFRKELCWRYKDQALYGDEIPRRTRTLMHNPKYRIPLWELVYHDCAVNYYYWADTTFMYPQLAPLKDLFCRLYGIPPIYSMNVSTWDRLKKDVAASYARASEVARETMFSRMTSFEWLTPDRLVQRTTFANGRSVTVDFREQYAEAVAAAPGGFKVMSYNVRHCEGMDRQLDLALIAAVVNRARPRFAALQELDCKAKRSKQIDEPQELGRLTGMFPTFAKTIDFQGGGYGVMLLSREKPLSVEKIPLPGAEPRVLLLAEFEDCFVGCTHLSVSAAKERADSVELIEKAVKGRAKPVFVAGDWNSLPDSSVLAGLSRFLHVLSPTDGRTYHGRPANSPSGTTTDFCIDYIAVDSVHAPHFTVVDRGVVADRVSSDHAPIFVTLGSAGR